MRSIMHDKSDGTCYLCMILNDDYMRRSFLEEHHCIGGKGRRALSERWGLKVYLCHEHHTGSDMSAHRNAKIGQMLKEKAQRAFESKWPDKSFMEIFGKSYVTADDEPSTAAVDIGFYLEEYDGI